MSTCMMAAHLASTAQRESSECLVNPLRITDPLATSTERAGNVSEVPLFVLTFGMKPGQERATPRASPSG
jgi:hypothetical protein